SRAPAGLGVRPGATVVISTDGVSLERPHSLLVLRAARATGIANGPYSRRVAEYTTRGRILLFAAPCSTPSLLARLAHSSSTVRHASLRQPCRAVTVDFVMFPPSGGAPDLTSNAYPTLGISPRQWLPCQR